MIDAKETIQNLDHINWHNQQLLVKYPDLKVDIIGHKIVKYYSNSINLEADEVNIAKDEASAYWFIYAAYPSKNVQINCLKCNGLIKVNSSPHKIPFLLEKGASYQTNFDWYSLTYEDLLKSHNFNSAILSAIQLYLLEELKNRSNHRIDTQYLTNSIKKLIPFT